MKAVGLSLSLTIFLLLCLPVEALPQSQTTGRIEGRVNDQNAAVIVQAEVTLTNEVTREVRKTRTNRNGDFAFFLLPPGRYRMELNANGFQQLIFENVNVEITETTRINAELAVGSGPQAALTISSPARSINADGPGLGRIVDSRAVSELPLATRNYTQILALSPGTDAGLADNSGVGRNSQNISVTSVLAG